MQDKRARETRRLRHRRDGEGLDSGPHQDAPRPAAHARARPPTSTPRSCATSPTTCCRRAALANISGVDGLRAGRLRAILHATSCRPAIGLLETVEPNFGDCLFHAADDAARRRPRCRVPAQLRQPDAAHRLPRGRRHRAGRARRPRRARALDRRRLLSHRPEAAAPPAVRGRRLEHRAGVPPRRSRGRDELGLPVHQLPAWYDVDDAARRCAC